jgi:hypothetical protein
MRKQEIEKKLYIGSNTYIVSKWTAPRIAIRMLVSGMRSSVETALLVLSSEISIDCAAKAS